MLRSKLNRIGIENAQQRAANIALPFQPENYGRRCAFPTVGKVCCKRARAGIEETAINIEQYVWSLRVGMELVTQRDARLGVANASPGYRCWPGR